MRTSQFDATRRGFVRKAAFTCAAFATGNAAAQPKLRRIAFLSTLSAASVATSVVALTQGLKELGYVEGKNLHVEYRYADGQTARIAPLVAEMAKLNVELIVTSGPGSTGPVRAATRTIPIVMGFDPDPVGSGFVASLARPGGNITGLSGLAPQIGAKQLQMLKELVPQLTRTAVLINSTTAGTPQTLKELEAMAAALRVKLQVLEVQSVADIEPAFQAVRRGQAEAVFVGANPVTTGNRAQVIKLVEALRLPAMYVATEFVDEGGLAVYGVSSTDLFRRAAAYVDRILKGAKPGDLPVEQPTVFEMAINLRTAKALGLKIPQAIVVQATRVVE
jgi:putative ABC transport system substrate-binding protein